MTNETITEDMKYQTLAQAIVSREHEIASYQLNIDNYNSVLASLPNGEWPEDLVQYKGKNSPSDMQKVPFDKLEAVSDLLFRDHIRGLLVTERVEQKKSQALRNAMIAQIPPEILTAKIAEITAEKSEGS